MWKVLNQKSQIHSIVDDLYKFGYAQSKDLVAFNEYKDELEDIMSMKDLMMEEAPNPEGLLQKFDLVEDELKWVNQTQIYRSNWNSIHRMESIVRCIWQEAGKLNADEFFNFKELVERINAFFKIEEPYKAPNKIAYGWNFSLKKGYQAFRQYLFACIRNYLRKNGVEFETSDLQKICCLREIDPVKDV